VTVQDPLQITTTSLPGVLVNSSYDQTLAAFGGDSPYTWSVITGSLPSGLSFSPSNGRITGTATTVGSSTFTLQVRDTSGQTVSREFTVSVYAPLVVTTGSLPTNLVVGNEYSVSLGASGGDGSYTWSISSGTLSGIPLSAVEQRILLRVTSGDGQTALSPYFDIDVYDPLEITTTSPLISGKSTYYTYRATVNSSGGGGERSYSWSISSGSLPAGLYLDAPTSNTINYTLITGTPTSVGSSTFTMRVTSKGQSAEKEFTITIIPW